MPSRPKGKSRRPSLETRPVDPGQRVSHLDATYLSHHKLMGRLVQVWSNLEGCMQALIWAFLRLPMSDGRIITSRLDASSMIPMLRSLGIRHLIDNRLQEYLDLLIAIDEYRNDRNFIVHGNWIVLQPHNVPAAMSLRPQAEAGEVVSETFPRQRMYEITDGIERCRMRLLSLEDELLTSRDKLQKPLPPEE